MILAVTGNASVSVDNDAIGNVNNTFHKISDQSFNFEKNPNLIALTIACAFTCVWFLFITFYNSQILGFIVTKLLSRFIIKDKGYLHIGSCSVSLLSGKVMFKNVQYVTKDYSCQIVDGLAIFKWWLRYDSKDLKFYRNLKKDNKDADLQSQNCRLVFFLNGLEVHYYNRFETYKDIEDRLKCERYGDAGTSTFSNDNVNSAEGLSELSDTDSTLSSWRELFPLVQMKIRSGKLAIGNRLLETTVWVHFNSGEAAYSCPDATSELDNFTHFVKCHCTDVRMLLSNSPGYDGPKSEPPSFMGEGFTVLQSAKATVTYLMDEPGVVPPDLDVSSMSDPEWGLDVKFQKNAKIWYGPWVDQQRFFIQKYFFPHDFRELPVTKPAEREELRVHSGFDVNVEFPKETTFHLLFTKNEETSAMHIVCYDTATFHYYQPWIVNEYGYSNNIMAHFQNIEISSSMTFQKLCECESAEINLNVTIPRMWNSFQCLKCEVWLTKTTCYYINDQLDFFNDLSKDWSSKEPPDIAKFLPYEWDFHLYIRDFELVLFANQFNWIDCTTTRTDDENNQLALCGETLDVSFNLAYTEFLPKTVETKFFFRGETVILRSFLPISNTLRRSVISLSHSSDRQMYPKFSYVASTDTCLDAVDETLDKQTGNGMSSDEQLSKGWRHRTGESDHWIDVWSVPVLVLNLYYTYHPVHFENEEIRNINGRCGIDYSKVEVNKLAPDVVNVELEAGPSAIRIFGTFWRQFFAGIKENYFGCSDHIYEFNASKTKKDTNKNSRTVPPTLGAATTIIGNNSGKGKHEQRSTTISSTTSADTVGLENLANGRDIRQYRPLEANITLVLLEIQAELTMHTCHDLPSPHVYTDRLTFEMKKIYRETKLQLIISPISIILHDALKRASDQSHLSKGFLALSGLQFRGHAMFSDKDIPLGGPTVEYGWLMEFQCAKLTGKITPLQIQLLLLWLNTFLLHVKDEENVNENPDPVVRCPHNQNQLECTHIIKGHKICPSEDLLKYKMFRFSIEAVDLYISEVECACNIQASPIRFSTCNSTSHEVMEGGSFFINEVSIRQFVQQLNLGLDDSPYPQYIPLHSNSWIEVGVIALGPVTADMKEVGKNTMHLRNQVKFLKLHDKQTKRLWFLWNAESLKNKLAADRCRGKICGCVGGCNFFDTNINGVRFFTNQSLDAASEQNTHYGSESLWGGQTGVGTSVKELINKMSDAASTSLSNIGSNLGSNVVRRYKKNGTGSVDRTLASGADTPDVFDGSGSFVHHTQNSNGSKASKLACDRSRSRSLMGQTASQHSLPKRTDSEDIDTFYSCESEADEENKEVDDAVQKTFRSRSRTDSARHASKHSLKSVPSSASYVSAMTEISDNDDGDGTFHAVGPLVSPGLLLAYTHYMQPVTCINWRQNIPSNFRRKFSLMKNLKLIFPLGSRSTLPSLPSFNPNVHGKLPFAIVSKREHSDERQNKISNSTIGNNSSMKEDKEKKSVVNIKLHRKVSLVLTPLLIQAIDRYISCLNTKESSNHVLHTLDALHNSCIEKSKKQFVENRLINLIDVHHEESNEEIRTKVNEMTPPNFMTMGLLVPEVDLIFLQISSEPYIQNEQSSLSGQCGSEYSDCDLKNTDCVLMTVKLSTVSFSMHQLFQNDHLFNCCIALSQRGKSMNTPNNFLDRYVTTCSSALSFSGEMKSLETQVMYLDGNNDRHTDRQVHVTRIPTSSVKFHVLQGGDVNYDAVSIADAASNKDILCNDIIFEAGIDGISVNGVFQKKINKELMEIEQSNNYNIKSSVEKVAPQKLACELGTNDGQVPKKGEIQERIYQQGNQDQEAFELKSNILDESTVESRNTRETVQNGVVFDDSIVTEKKSANAYVPVTNSKPDFSVVSVLDEDLNMTEAFSEEDEHAPMLRKNLGSLSRGSLTRDDYPITTNDYSDSEESSLDNSSLGSCAHIASTRKGYIALDVDYHRGVEDTSDVDADDEHEDEDGHVSINAPPTESSVKFKKGMAKKSTETNTETKVKVEPVVLMKLNSDLKLSTVWVNLAAPTHLRNIHYDEVHSLNLVNVLVPAIGCWLAPVYDFIATVNYFINNDITWKRSVLACFMGQGLPEQMVKKHTIPSAVSALSEFLQEEYSSQLIYVMRRQSDGHRLLSIKKSLMKASYSPKPDDLLAGIHALARPWKCMLIGAEVPENQFGVSDRGTRKPVVGRGKLTKKDLDIIKQNFPQSLSISDNPSVESPVEVIINENDQSNTSSPSERTGNHKTISTYSATDALLSRSISEVCEEVPEDVDEVGHEELEDIVDEKMSPMSNVNLNSTGGKRESFYDWMKSRSPPASGIASPIDEMMEDKGRGMDGKNADDIDLGREAKEADDLISVKLDNTTACQLDLLRSNSPMVSVPTSGTQLAKAAVVFNAIFSAVGVKSGTSKASQISGKGTLLLEKFQINLKEEEIEPDETLPAFVVENLTINLKGSGGREHIVNYTPSMKPIDLVSNEMKFFVDVRDIHHHLDFKFVRLVLQITETMKVLTEQKRYAQKNKDSVTSEKGYADWDKVTLDMNSEIEEMPKSWRNMYQVMNLYKINIEEQQHYNSSNNIVSPPITSPTSLLKQRALASKDSTHENGSAGGGKSASKEMITSPKASATDSLTGPSLSVTGTAYLKKAKLTASISGLDLDFEMKSLSGTYMKDRKKEFGADGKESAGVRTFDTMSSLSVHINKLTVCLLESIKGKKTMMECRVTRSHMLNTTMTNQFGRLTQRSLLAIGPIVVEIPQHPGALRNIIAQFTARLQTHYMEFDGYRVSKGTDNDMVDLGNVDVGSRKESNSSATTSSMFRVTCRTIQLTAALLPSLSANYNIDKVNGWGSVNGKVTFFFHLPSHVLSFNTRAELSGPLPETTNICLPPIKVDGKWIEIPTDRTSLHPSSGIRGHSYLPIQVNIGPLVHNLSTDLLNHLVFLQKGFAKEVNEVVQDVGTNEPIPLWKKETEEELVSSQPMRYSIKLKIDTIIITATTPSSTGVRLKTGEIFFELANQNPQLPVIQPHYPSSKMYGSAGLVLNLSLGQFNSKPFPGAEDQDLSVFANFCTSLSMRNAAHEDRFDTDYKETIYITLEKPQLFVMPAAVDKGVSVYLHYKNAYDQWVEQRSNLSTEYSTVAERILNRFPAAASTENVTRHLFLQVFVNDLGIGLPLRETASLPTTTLTHGLADIQPGTALLITITNTVITCCNSGSFAMSGHFRDFCIQFAEDFDHNVDNWCHDIVESINTYKIPEGSYEVCSRSENTIRDRTTGAQLPGKWMMTVFWKMRGIDVNLDVNIGKRLSLLFNVLTAITGDSDVADLSSLAEAEDMEKESAYQHFENDDDVVDGVEDVYDTDVFGGQDQPEVSFLGDWPTDNLQESKTQLQKKLSYHTRQVDKLRRNNASPEQIGKEVKSLQEVELMYKNQFLKDVRKKFRSRSTRVRPTNLNVSNSSNTMRKKSSEMKRNSLYLPAEEHESYLPNFLDSFDMVDGQQSNVLYDPNDEKYSIRRASMEERRRPLHFDEFEPSTSTMVKFSDSTCDVREKADDKKEKDEEDENISQQHDIKTDARPTALDFELNVMADIDTGKCTFHTSEGETKEEDSYLRELDRRHRPPRTAASSVVGEDTVILIPGVNVRVHYLSTNLVDKTTGDRDDSESAESSSLHSSNFSKQQVKTADLNALILIQSLSKEMVVRPSLLDFLEQALEPIMEDVAEKKDFNSPSSPDTGTESGLSSSNSSLYSFPVNVSVLIRVDPSDLRFSCLPISKVECWLRIPSLDFAITRTQAPYITPLSTSPRKRSVMGGKDSLPTTQGSSNSGDVADISAGFSFTLCLSRFSFCIFHPYGAAQYGSTSEIRSGLQSKCMFTDQKKEPKRFSLPMLDRRNSLALNVEFIKFNLFRKTMKVPLDQVSSSSNNTQEFRTEVGVSAICDLGSASFTYDMRRLNEILDFPKAWYKRGLVQRIFLGEEGSYATQTPAPQTNKATETPLSEASLRDGFIHPADRSHSELQLHRNSQTLKQPPRKAANLTSHRRAVSGSSHFFSSLMSPFPIPRASTVGSRKDILTQSQDPVRVRSTSDFTFSPSTTDLDSTPEPTESLTSQSQVCNQWETNVVIAFKVSRIDMSTNMGNIMGQASWNTHDLNANCNILLNNTGKRTGQFDVSVQKCKVQATGGVIGITADLEDIKSEMEFDENLGFVPNHAGGSSVKSLELRLDYMGASIIMATLHALRLKLNDEWIIPQLPNSPRSFNASDEPGGGTNVKCEISLMCDTSWDEFQLIISRSTTPDIVKIISKLEDFFDQQHRNSIRALSSFRRHTNRTQDYMSGSLTSTPKNDEKNGENKDKEDGGLKYQHWMKILNGVTGLKLKNIALPLPEKNIVLGGKLVLHGTFFSLACFHANNFRSQTWGLFQMIGPCIEFTTKNQAFEKSCQVMRGKSLQSLTVSLGESTERHVSERRKSSSNMQDFKATVRQVSRGSRNPPSLGAHVQEWMSFVNTISDDDLPAYSSSPANRQNTQNEKFSHTKVSSNIRKVSFAPKFRYENKSDVIFALPGLSVKLDTEHDMPMTCAIAKELRKVEQKPTNFVMKPSNHTVDINFVSDFDDSLTVDISKVIFLHDLVLNYMKEKEASVTVSSSRTTRHKNSDASAPTVTTSPKNREQDKLKETNMRKTSSGKEKEIKKSGSMKRTDSIKKEEKYREFRTLQWKLEPTLSMYTWGSRTDPINIKSVLQNLGFMHAALTIPKWMQRGVLDPMDVILAKLVRQVLARMVENDDDEKKT